MASPVWYKLVLLDMQMPDLTGFEVAEALVRRGIDLPLIMMSAGLDIHRQADEIAA